MDSFGWKCSAAVLAVMTFFSPTMLVSQASALDDAIPAVNGVGDGEVATTVGSPIAVGAKPVIRNFRAQFYAGYVLVTGKVTDSDSSVGGLTVFIYGSISGQAVTRSDGVFIFTVAHDYPYGEVYAHTVDPEGNESWMVATEFYE